MKDWHWIAKRRRLSLENYLSDVSSLDAAYAKFEKDKIVPPSREELLPFFDAVSKGQESVVSQPSPTPKQSLKSAKQKPAPEKKKSSDPEPGGDYDELFVLDPESSES